MVELPEMKARPIGFVRSEVKEAAKDLKDWWQELESEIVLDENLAAGLEGLEKYSHIIVVYWLNKLKSDEVLLKIRPRNSEDSQERGLFATRSPRRPNPLGLITVRLLRREGNVLTVKGLDALDGTPVIDIKPYNTGYDSPDGGKPPGE